MGIVQLVEWRCYGRNDRFYFLRDEGPRSRCYGRTAALRPLVQPLWWRWAVFYQVSQLMEHQWNEIDRGKPTTRRKTCPSATLSTTNLTWTDPGFFFPVPFFSFDPFCTFKSFCPSRSILLSLYNKHNTNIHAPRRDSNPQSQQANGRRPTP
jgi:hypothetical protein